MSVSHYYNTWQAFSLLYRPNAVNPVCHDEADYSCGSSLCAPCHVNLPIETDIGCHVGCLLEKSGSVTNRTSKSRRMCLIILSGSLLLYAPLFTVGRHSLTLQCHAELHVDHKTVTDLSQLCRKSCQISF